MNSKYRIITQSGDVHVQKQWQFFCFSGWSYINGYGESSIASPMNFPSVEDAKAYIDRQIAQEIIWNQPQTITPYPALGFPSPVSKPS